MFILRGGTVFNVSYTPVEYGKEKIGKLIIQTDLKYFSYLVRGTFPPHEPPKNVKGKVFESIGLPSITASKQLKSSMNGQPGGGQQNYP